MEKQKQTTRWFWARVIITIAAAAGMFLPMSDLEAGQVERNLRIGSIIDQTVQNAKGQELGEIEDLILRRNGKVKKAIISLDGLLEIGDKNVATPFRSLKIDNAEKIVYEKTKEQLEDQPAFHYRKQGLYTGYYQRPYLPGTPGGPNGPYAPGYGPDPWGPSRGYPYYPHGGPYAYWWYGYGPYGGMPEAFPGAQPDSGRSHYWEWAYYPANMLGSVVLGRVVINKQGEEVGEVADLIIGSDNKIENIILSVGGFLGIGDKLVAVPYKPIGFTTYGIIRYDISREDLEDKPAFSFSQ